MFRFLLTAYSASKGYSFGYRVGYLSMVLFFRVLALVLLFFRVLAVELWAALTCCYISIRAHVV